MNMKIGTVVAIVLATVLLFGGGFALGMFTGRSTAAVTTGYGYGACAPSSGMMGTWSRNMPSGMYRDSSMALCPAVTLQDDESLDATADRLGLSSEELEQRLSQGESLWDVAEAQGLSESESSAWMHELMDERLDQAVQSGFLSEEQAGAMEERMDWMEESGLAPAAGCWSGRGGMRGFVR